MISVVRLRERRTGVSLISKQVDELRSYAADRKGELAKLVSDAADTIEMLSAELSAAETSDRRKD